MARLGKACLGASLIALGAVLVACSATEPKGVGFDGGLQIVGFVPEATDATLTVCFDNLRCTDGPVLAGRADAPDFYPFSLPPDPVDAADQWKPHSVHITVKRQDGSVRLDGQAQAKTSSIKPARCYGAGPVIAVTWDSAGKLQAGKPDLRFSCDGVESPSK